MVILACIEVSDEILPLDCKTPLFYTQQRISIPVDAGGDLRSRLHYGDYPRTINDVGGIELLKCLR